MQNLFKLIPIILLVGCGGGSHKIIIDDTTPPPPTEIYEINMELYKPYIVTTGDKVIKKTENAHIKIIHTEDDINSTVELIDGEADLIYITPILIENNSTKDSNKTDTKEENSIF